NPHPAVAGFSVPATGLFRVLWYHCHRPAITGLCATPGRFPPSPLFPVPAGRHGAVHYHLPSACPTAHPEKNTAEITTRIISPAKDDTEQQESVPAWPAGCHQRQSAVPPDSTRQPDCRLPEQSRCQRHRQPGRPVTAPGGSSADLFGQASANVFQRQYLITETIFDDRHRHTKDNAAVFILGPDMAATLFNQAGTIPAVGSHAGKYHTQHFIAVMLGGRGKGNIHTGAVVNALVAVADMNNAAITTLNHQQHATRGNMHMRRLNSVTVHGFLYHQRA